VEKIEADLRLGMGRLAAGPLALIGAVQVSPEPAARDEDLLLPVIAGEATAWLAANQPYASSQPGWQPFVQALVQRGVYRLRRGRGPQAAVDALCRLLDGHAPRPRPRVGTDAGGTTFPGTVCTQER